MDTVLGKVASLCKDNDESWAAPNRRPMRFSAKGAALLTGGVDAKAEDMVKTEAEADDMAKDMARTWSEAEAESVATRKAPALEATEEAESVAACKAPAREAREDKEACLDTVMATTEEDKEACLDTITDATDEEDYEDADEASDDQVILHPVEKLAPRPPDSDCWDWPLSRREKVVRVHDLDKKILKQEVLGLRRRLSRGVSMGQLGCTNRLST